MSYILDALKKSEREKTLGQVPTLETVISDGAKKKRSGTPWWLNLVVFIVAVLAVLAVLKMMNLIDFSDDDNLQAENVATQQAQQTQQPAVQQQTTEQLDPVQNNEIAQSEVNTQPAEVQTSPSSDIELAETVEIQQEPGQLEAQTVQLDPAVMQPETEGLDDQSSEQLDQSDENELAAIEQTVMQSGEDELQQPAVVETAVQPEQPVAQEPVQTEQVAVVDQKVEEQYSYEEDLHQDLRNISVNVVSYSSDAKQRFVMLDLTIYKEEDILPNDAQVLSIIRNGAIIEYQNKRYFLKP